MQKIELITNFQLQWKVDLNLVSFKYAKQYCRLPSAMFITQRSYYIFANTSF